MEFYQVGGCVRDDLLGLQAGDRDWVVTGATPEQLLAEGYRAVGHDFPVFLHPQSHEEVALARTERKTAPGYRGFDVHASPEVTLEDDLSRRDLTINAIARSDDGELIDPFGGVRDLQQRWLRHVSPAFVEDPVRILRAARFAARFASLGFRVHPDTLALMREMVAAGEVSALVPERVWAETHKALGTERPDAFVSVLRECGALGVVFPELDALFGVPQPPKWHPEVDTGVHMLLVLRQAATLGAQDPMVVFAAFCHDFGKGTTPAEKWPSHPGHEQRSAEMLIALSERLRIPNDFRDLAVAVARYHGNIHRALELRPGTILRLLEQMDVLRRPDRLGPILLACEADFRGRTSFEDRPYPQAQFLQTCAEAAAAVRLSAEQREGLAGPQIGEAIRRERLEAVSAVRRAFTSE
ncbi:MAG: multifunctional CCA addition/repair protein [Pseudomonadota bacterium]